jgi:hypothetical protein
VADEGTDRSARAPAPEDVARICDALNRAGARYVLIGGFAVYAHGSGRTTKDIDLLVDDSPDNVARIRTALQVLPDKAGVEVRDNDLRDYTVVRVADEVVVDLMGAACGVRYDDAISDADLAEIDGIEVPVASIRTLIRTKQTLRPSDIADRQFLESLLKG